MTCCLQDRARGFGARVPDLRIQWLLRSGHGTAEPAERGGTRITRGGEPCHDGRVSNDLVSVLWTSSLVEAEIAKGRLEAESIPVQLTGEGADDPFPVGPAELLVPSRFEEEARRILAQSEDGSDRS
jgi:hypothetical protein